MSVSKAASGVLLFLLPFGRKIAMPPQARHCYSRHLRFSLKELMCLSDRKMRAQCNQGLTHQVSSYIPQGLVPEQTRQVEEAQEDHQCLQGSRDPAAHSSRPASVPLGSSGSGGHGRQPLLLPRQRYSLGHGWNAQRVPAAAAACPGSPAGHGPVTVSVQPGCRPAAQLHGPVQHVVQRLGPPVALVPAHLSWHGAGLAVRPHQRERLAPTVQLPGQRRLERDKHRIAAPQSARAHSVHELYLVAATARAPPSPTPPLTPGEISSVHLLSITLHSEGAETRILV